MPNLFGRASAVDADHARLRAAWRHLRQRFRGANASGRSVDSWQLIAEFASELRAHFAEEESGGYFGALVEERPQLQAQVEQLRAEHRVITALLDRVLAAGAEAVNLGSLDAQVRELLNQFQHHEQAEAILLQDFFACDVGGEGP